MEESTRQDILNILRQPRIKPIFLFEGEEFGRRGAKRLVALTRCEITLDSQEKIEKCALALKESDEHLKQRPEEQKVWDWQSPMLDRMTISFGVAWYDMDFYREKRDAWKNPTHLEQYIQFGASLNDFTVTHYVIDES